MAAVGCGGELGIRNAARSPQEFRISDFGFIGAGKRGAILNSQFLIAGAGWRVG